jgi:hypothetical protein
MSDDLLDIPQVPDAKPDDPEDVSWALSTAEAMWARGDHSEGIKWVRRAAEAASEAEKDMRAVELAKAAAELQGMLTRMSVPDKGSERNIKASSAASRPPPMPRGGSGTANSSGPVSTVPATSRSIPPISRGAPSTKQSGAPPPGKASGRSIPPIPLPSKASVPPAGGASPSKAPEAPAAKAAPRPLSTPSKSQGPASGKGVLSNKPDARTGADKKGRRRSRENLEDEARAAGVLDVSAHASMSPSDTDEITALSPDDAIPLSAKKSGSVSVTFDQDATMIGSKETIERGRKRSVDEWDKSPTQNIPGSEQIDDGDRKTEVGGGVGAAPTRSVAPSVTQQRAATPASMPPRAAPRASPSIIPHDDSIKTSQAIRVVVWRDANGVHVAPEGTVVSAIKIDAMLVALEPTADLTAWLSRKDR